MKNALVMLALLAALLVVACGGEKKDADPRAALLETWKTGGLVAGPLEPATAAAVGSDCKATTVKALEVLLCVYPTAEAAKAAEEPGLAWVGAATGAVTATGTVLVAVVDRRATDPSGKTINQLLKLAPK